MQISNVGQCSNRSENLKQKSNVRKLNVASNAMTSDACECLMQISNDKQCNAVSNKLSENLIQVTNVGLCNNSVSSIAPVEGHSLLVPQANSQIPAVIYSSNFPVVHSEEVLMRASKSIQGNASSNVNSKDLIKYGTSNVVSDKSNVINNLLSQARHISSQISPVIYDSNFENNVCMPSDQSNIVNKPSESIQTAYSDIQAFPAELNNNNNNEMCQKRKTDNIDTVKTWPFSNYSIPNTPSSDAKMVTTPLLQMHVANQISPIVYSPLSNLETDQRKILIQASNIQCDRIANVMPICNSVNSSLLQTGNIVCPTSPVLYGGSVASNDPRKVFIQGSQPFGNIEDSSQVQPAYYVLVDSNQNIIQK